MSLRKLLILVTLLTVSAVGLASPPGAGALAGSLRTRSIQNKKPTLKGQPRSPQLKPGKSIERELRSNETHSYLIRLQAGQFVRAEVEQSGIDVHVSIYSPEQEKLAEIDSPNGTRGIESVIVPANTTATYRIQISPDEKEAPAGRYRIRMEQPRALTEQDRTLIDAQHAFSEAGELQARETPESLRKSIAKYEEALLLYDLGGDALRKVDALHYIGRAYHLLGNPNRAMFYNKRALELLGTTKERGREGFVLDAIGTAHEELGEPERGLEFFERALEVRRTIGDRRWMAMTLKHIGYTSFALAKVQRAVDAFQEAALLYGEAGDFPTASSLLAQIGWAYLFAGDAERSIASYRRALSMTLKAGGNGEAIYLALGRAYHHFGDLIGAEESLKKALDLSRNSGNRSVQAGSLVYLCALNIGMHKIAEADVVFSEAKSLGKSITEPNWELDFLSEVGSAYLQAGYFDNAERILTQTLSLSREQHQPIIEANMLNNLGYLYRQLGDEAKAREYLTAAVDTARTGGNRFTELASLLHLSRAERALGDLDNARAHIEAALELLNTRRLELRSRQSRSVYFAGAHEYYEVYEDVLSDMRRRLPAAGYEVVAFEASEQARGRSLLDLLNDASPSVSAAVEPELRQREESLRHQLNRRVEGRLRSPDLGATEQRRARTDEEVSQLTADYQYALAELRLRERGPSRMAQGEPRSLSEIQRRALDPDTLLLEYMLGEKQSHLWVVSNDSITEFELAPRAEIETTAQHLRDLFVARLGNPPESSQERRTRISLADAAIPEAARRLSEMLVGPVSQQLGSKRLLVVVEGTLQRIPFGALQDLSAGAGSEEYQPLIVNHEVVNLPSASILVAVRERAARRAPPAKAIAVIADPVFDSHDPRVKPDGAIHKRGRKIPSSDEPYSLQTRALQAISSRGGTLARLAFSREEALRVSELAPSKQAKVALDFDANRNIVMGGELSHYRIVHLASHSWIDLKEPELSGIVLSLVDERGRSQEGFLGLGDIYNLNLPVELVTLSACRSAIGKDMKGEGLVGMTGAFMSAGANRVVASIWKVDDFATAQLMKRFYTRILKGGQAPAAALRGAQLEMWRTQQWKSPYFWAAFQLLGEWN